MDIVQSMRGHAVYATHIEDTCATGVTTRIIIIIILYLFNREALASEKYVSTYMVRRYSGRTQVSRSSVYQSGLGDVTISTCHIWHINETLCFG